jgi:hypothetical protein
MEIPQFEIRPDDCNLSVGAYIPESYNNDLPFEPDAGIDVVVPDIDKEVAEFQALILRQTKMLSRDPSKPYLNKDGPEVAIAFDSEYTVDPVTGENIILSVQFHGKGDQGEFKKIIYPKTGSKADRPSFSRELLKMILEGLDNGCISEMPRCVTAVGFFVRLDLAAFSDLCDFKTELDSAGGKVTTIGKGIDFTFDQTGQSLPRKKSSVVSDGVGLFILSTKFIDLGRHVEEGTTLEAIGKWLGLDKLELPDGYSKSRMDLLLQEEKVFFDAYAMRDAEITLRFYERLEKFAFDRVGCKSLPSTISSLAVQLLKKTLKENKIDFDDAWGFETHKTQAWNDRQGKVCSKQEVSPNAFRKISDPLVILTYHGGRNECFHVGPTHIGDWFDYDLAGAYTTGLVDLREIDYAGMWHTTNPLDFVGHVLGFAWVEFKCSDNDRIPALPVDMGILGLVYPLAGTSYCTAPEIEEALNHGCKIIIKQGIIFPWKDGDLRSFEPFVTEIRDLRAEYKKDRTDPKVPTLDELYAKLAGNSAYGKLAQGLKEKTVFNTRGMCSTKLPPSAITNAIMASHVTGLVRAVMTEQMTRLPREFTVVSVTTDGYLTNAPFDRLDLNGPLSRRFRALCERVAPGTAMLECKHHVCQLVAAKTRCQMTALPSFDAEGEPTPIVLAKGSVTPPVSLVSAQTKEEKKIAHNKYMLDLYLNRQPGQKTISRPFTPLREQWTYDVDVTKSERASLLNLEYDFKRRPVNPRMVAVAGTEHIALDTVPWPTAEIGGRARAYFDGSRRQRCLKALADWDAWQTHFQFSTARGKRAKAGAAGEKRGINMTKDGPVGLMKRTFLRAFVRNTWGVVSDGDKLTHQAMADWLSSIGYETKKAAVSNSIREELVEHLVPAADEVVAFIKAVQLRFPDMEVARFLIPVDTKMGC